MTKRLAAIASVLLLSGTAAMAAEWPSFNSLDTDGSGKISRVEWEKNVGKLKLAWAPNFSAMDSDNNNGVDEEEWAAAEKLSNSYSDRCNSASSSWCKEAK